LLLRAGFLLVSVFVFQLAARAADTNPPPRLTVELRDGSRVVGTSAERIFTFHSALLGEIKFDVNDLRTIDCLTTNSARLTTANGDTLTVWFAKAELRVNTGFGKLELPVSSLRRLTVSPAGHSNQRREGLVLFWSGDGEGKDNVGTDPDTLNALGPSGSVMVSNNAALVSMQQTRQISFEAWIKPRSVPHEFPVLLRKGGNWGSAYGGYELYLNANGDNDLTFVSGGYGVDTHNANGRWINQHLGEWIHVAFTLDDRTKAAKFYVNGQPTNDEFNSGTDSDLNFDLPNNLYIGAPDPASHPNRARFDGEIRNVMLFNRVLTAKEIRTDFEAGHPD
jgi:hypothetical protein